MESLAEANRRLRILDDLGGQFLTFISHELATPLSMIAGVDLLQEGGQDSKQTPLVQAVRRGYERLREFVQKSPIPRIEELHWLFAKTLIEKMTRFTGDDVRFLRKSLGLSGADFARRMGVTVETVSRWEHNAVAIGPMLLARRDTPRLPARLASGALPPI